MTTITNKYTSSTFKNALCALSKLQKTYPYLSTVMTAVNQHLKRINDLKDGAKASPELKKIVELHTPNTSTSKKIKTFSEELLGFETDINAPNQDGCKPISIASVNGHVKVIEILHALGADIHTPDEISGATPMCLATARQQREVIAMLHSLGVNVNTPDQHGNTPVYIATEQGYPDILEMLYTLGANINTPTSDGITPIHLAVVNQDLDEVQRSALITKLCELGADVDIQVHYPNLPSLSARDIMIRNQETHLIVDAIA